MPAESEGSQLEEAKCATRGIHGACSYRTGSGSCVLLLRLSAVVVGRADIESNAVPNVPIPRRLARLALAVRQGGQCQAIRIEKAETPRGGLADTDPRRDGDSSGSASLAQPEAGTALEEPSPRTGSVEAEPLGQFSRPAGGAQVDPLSEGLGSSDEDAPGCPFRPRREVEAIVNPIDQVHVDRPWRPPTTARCAASGP